MVKLYSSDYVVYDVFHKVPLRFSGWDIIVYWDKLEAEDDCAFNEKVIRCTELPEKLQQELIKQVSRN